MTTQRTNGFTLIEVLVAMVMLGIGLLGLAGLQNTGLRSGHSSSMRTQATMLAADMGERKHANKLAVDGFGDDLANHPYIGAFDADFCADLAVLPGTICSDNQAVDAVECTPQQMAVFDRYDWFCGMPGEDRDMTRGLLINATADISCVDRDTVADIDECTNGSTYVVTLNWDESDIYDEDPDANIVTRSVVLSVQP